MMKIKILSIILSLVLIVGILFFHLPNTLASSSSYYSSENKPEFYGLTKTIIQKGDLFSPNDSKFRIFARDFEDGDLTNSIIVTKNNVNSNEIGSYEVSYEVADSDNNKTTLNVIVEVIDNINEGRYYERKLYSLPSVENMILAGTNRGNNHDRQILGLYLEKNAEISIKKISGAKDLTLTYLNNDSKTEENFTITNNYIDISFLHDGVPFIKTVYEEESVVIGIKENNSKVHSLPYYHYGDNEVSFFQNWNQLMDSYAVLESEDLTVLVSYHDKDKLINYYKNCFNSLNSFFAYWHKVINQYDEYLGLSYNPSNPIDQNVKTKYFIKANKNGAGSAYYAWDHVGINSKSVASFFEMNWGGLHEVGHGYQGSLKNDLEQGEVSNNILGYYVQKNKELNPYSLNWLGDISKIEDNYQKIRLSGKSYYELDVAGRLYFAVELLNFKNPKETYAEINKIWRRSIQNKQNITTIDAYVLAFYNLYKINIVPYFDTWQINVSENIKEKVSTGSIPTILYDAVKDKTQTIKLNLNKAGKYSLVSNQELKKYNLTGNLNLTLKIDNISELKGKKIVIKNETYQREIKIESTTTILNNIPVGCYQIILPVPKNNIYEYEKYNYIVVSNNETSNLQLSYKNSDIDLTNDSVIELRGLGDQLFADINFKNQTLVITSYGLTPHSYFDSWYAKIIIYDTNNQVVFNKEYIGNQNYSKEINNISYQEGYKIIIYHKEANGRLIIRSSILGEINSHLATVRNEANTYIIGKYGLYQENQDNYQNYLVKIEKYISKLKTNLTEIELANKNLKVVEKRRLLLSILKLVDDDKNKYLIKYQSIYNGSFPYLNKTKIEIYEDEILNLYQELKAIDLEDGTYNLTNANLIFDDKLLEKILPGNYQISYQLMDSDNNITAGVIDLRVLDTLINNENKKPNISDNNYQVENKNPSKDYNINQNKENNTSNNSNITNSDQQINNNIDTKKEENQINKEESSHIQEKVITNSQDKGLSSETIKFISIIVFSIVLLIILA